MTPGSSPASPGLPVDLDRHGSVALLTLNRSDSNSLSEELLQALAVRIDDLARESVLRCLVIRGRGPNFCTGADFRGRLGRTAPQLADQRAVVLSVFDRLDAFPVPVIAACHGDVVAGGMELALACDIRVATTTSRWALPEVLWGGTFPGGQGPIRLQRLIAGGTARLLVFTGRDISGTEAHALGIVDVLLEPASLEAGALALAAEIAANSPLAVRAAKELMRRSPDLSMSDATELSQRLRTPLDVTADAAEAIKAFTEGRRPGFRGQ